MAFQFNAILDFKADKAVAGMKQAKTGFTQFKDSVGKANESFSKLAGGAQSGAIALAPLSAGFGFAIKDAAEFQHGLAAVQGTMLETSENMRPLALVTKQLGAATKFSAVEATQGAKFFAQAGFDMQQIIAALPGAMDAAAAGEIDLATTTDIMASSMGAFGIEAGRASEVADVLALTASLTNTDIIGLGEGLKYSAATARQAGMSIQETSSALGVMANAGLKGSMGGTALQNALIQLTKPTKDVLALFGGKDGFNAAIKDSAGNLLPFEVIMANTSKIVSQAADPLEAAGRAAEIFGLRGGKAFGAFTGQLQETVTVNDIMLERFKKAGINVEAEGIKIGSVIPKLVALRHQILGADGAAKQMAEIRMSSFLGQIEEMSGATQGLSIEVGELLLGSLTEGSKTATDALSMLAFGFQALNMSEEEVAKMQGDVNDKNNTMFNQFGSMLPLFREFAGGFKEGLVGVIEGLKEGFIAVKEFISGFSESGMSAKEIGKLVAQVALVGAMLAPVLAGIVAFAFIMGPIFSAVSGFFGMISAGWGLASGAFLAVKGAVIFLAGALGIAVGPFLLIAAAIIGIIALVVIFRKEIAEFIVSFAGFVKETASEFYNDFVEVLTLFAPFVDQVVSDILGYFANLGNGIVDMLVFAFDTLKPVLIGFGKFMLDILLTPLRLMVKGITSVIGAIAEYIPNSILEKVGLSQVDLQNFASMEVPTFSEPFKSEANVSDATQVAKDNNKLSQNMLTQTALVQPPSADEISSVLGAQAPNQSQQQQGGGQQTVKVVVEGRIRGQDLNLVQTKSQIEQSQLNGRSLDPITKRRAVQNGSQF